MSNYSGQIGQNSIIKEDVILGEASKVWHFCNLYGCKIGSNTQIGSYTEIKKGAVIGNNCRIQSYVFIPDGTKIGNNVFLGPGVKIMNDKYPTARKTIKGEWNLEAAAIEDEVTIGGGAIIGPGVRIGRGAFVAMGAIVIKDVAEYKVVAGNPARVIGDTREGKYARELGRMHESSI